MKVTVERGALLRSLGHVHRVVERRNTIPILANVLIKAEKSKLTFKATDLDVEVTETIAAEVGPGGATTVPAHMFYEIVRKLPEGAQIVLEASGDRQDPICHLHRGDALLPQRHLSPHRRYRQGAYAARGRHRWASPGAI